MYLFTSKSFILLFCVGFNCTLLLRINSKKTLFLLFLLPSIKIMAKVEVWQKFDNVGQSSCIGVMDI